MLGKVHEGRMRILPGAEAEEEGGRGVGDQVSFFLRVNNANLF